MIPVVAAFLAAVAVLGAGCRDREPAAPRPSPLRFWHTFNPAETEALNRELARHGGAPRVEATLLPFARAQLIVDDALSRAEACPDLVRVDATWLPALRDRLRPLPDGLAGTDLLAEAAELATAGGVTYGLPQALDGLVVLAPRDAPLSPWPPRDLPGLIASVRAATPARLGVRVDGYWFVPFLRAAGGSLRDEVIDIDGAEAVRAVSDFAALFGPGGVAPGIAGDRDQGREIRRRFVAGELAAVIDGPWAVFDLSGGDPESLTAAALPGAPRGGTLLVVPRCAARPDEAWELAQRLTAPALQGAWARRLGVVPTTRAGLAAGGRLAGEIHAALRSAEPLPRHRFSAELFDDLTPALEAVVAGDATADEALAGVARSWRRRMAR